MLSNVTPIGYVRHSHNKGIVAIQNIYIYKKKSHLGRNLIQKCNNIGLQNLYNFLHVF